MHDDPYQVIYLTGPPASGKSTLVTALEAQLHPLLSFTYSKVLAQHVSSRDALPTSQSALREKSARIIHPEDVEAVDQQLLTFVEENRGKSHIVIDSHAVTKESYGFRVTSFSLEKLLRLRPTRIFMLYTEASVVQSRIKSAPAGRPQISAFEADFHTQLQATVAIDYGIHLGVPVYFLDSNTSLENLSETVIKRL